ncbi:hypothetical protein KY290_033607 [Solanum tuberosum]|uniref:DUF4283 domain-containing protein n=1 Tax=Solanum tuberosum TaxID=4113 RepID=A0ABQ7U1V6_SOLTU|nr:hypothetical protein KY289_035041 [Solanum tuberosum]KAH0649259.1 hypothetical protein KY285_034507 [Solanum tuberosum]KAH0740564.1 hypothetical protein KY290_033607 [Solanum tuberosum]
MDPDFTPEEETPIVPIWVALPELPWHCYNKVLLTTILSPIGKVLYLDSPSSQKTRGSMARVKIQIDLTKERPPHVWVGFKNSDPNKGMWQKEQPNPKTAWRPVSPQHKEARDNRQKKPTPAGNNLKGAGKSQIQQLSRVTNPEGSPSNNQQQRDNNFDTNDLQHQTINESSGQHTNTDLKADLVRTKGKL